MAFSIDLLGWEVVSFDTVGSTGVNDNEANFAGLMPPSSGSLKSNFEGLNPYRSTTDYPFHS